MPIPYLYPYDPTGAAATNHISNELHNVSPPPQDNDANFIVPRAAPFFLQGMTIRTGANVTDPVLTLGVDYIFTHPFIEATNFLNKLIYGSILFLDREYTGDVYLTYQTMGGSYTLDDYDVVEELTRKLYNIRMVSWTQILGLPLNFPPLPHQTNAADMIGMTDVVQQLGQILLSLQAAGVNLNTLMVSFAQHLNGINSHNKAQVGLHLVPNYAKAAQTDLETQSDSTLMTPYQTLKMISIYGGGSGNGNSLSDDNKVDKTTMVTGGGLASGGGDLSTDRVIMVTKAAKPDIVGGSNDTKAITPSSGVHLISRWSQVAYLPTDGNLDPIIDIDLLTCPGRYIVHDDMINAPVNVTKIPAVLRSALNHYSAELEVVNCLFQNNGVDGNGGVIQRLYTTLASDNAGGRRVFERNALDDTNVVWTPWRTIDRGFVTQAMCVLEANDDTLTLSVNANVEEVTSHATPGGYNGNYSGFDAPASAPCRVYRVRFAAVMEDTNYVVSHTLTTDVGTQVCQLILLDKYEQYFTFYVTGLNNYGGGSNSHVVKQFKVEFVVTGHRTITLM